MTWLQQQEAIWPTDNPKRQADPWLKLHKHGNQSFNGTQARHPKSLTYPRSLKRKKPTKQKFEETSLPQKIPEEKYVANKIPAGHVFTLCGNISHGFSIANLKISAFKVPSQTCTRCFIDNMGVSQIECPTINNFCKHGEITKNMVFLQKSFAKVKYDHFASSRIPTTSFGKQQSESLSYQVQGMTYGSHSMYAAFREISSYMYTLDQCTYIYIYYRYV